MGKRNSHEYRNKFEETIKDSTREKSIKEGNKFPEINFRRISNAKQ